jgi:hypothetical protein
MGGSFELISVCEVQMMIIGEGLYLFENYDVHNII